jgi:hypothetical protein
MRDTPAQALGTGCGGAVGRITGRVFVWTANRDIKRDQASNYNRFGPGVVSSCASPATDGGTAHHEVPILRRWRCRLDHGRGDKLHERLAPGYCCRERGIATIAGRGSPPHGITISAQPDCHADQPGQHASSLPQPRSRCAFPGRRLRRRQRLRLYRDMEPQNRSVSARWAGHLHRILR